MSQTKPLLLTSLALVLALAVTAAATVQVTNLQMTKNGQFTELTIVCSENCDFTHQIVEQAANKPYRIVVDIQDAVHGLPQHSFSSLPGGTIKQVRTSQFSTDPEKVVRVVVDAAGTVTYKVKAGENGVTLFINTPNDKDFPLWSAVPGSAPVVVATQPAAPKPMPAIEGNEENAPKVDKTDPAKQDLKLAAKPIDEGKLLNKKPVNSSVNQTPAVPAAVANPANETKPVAENLVKSETVSQPAPVQIDPSVLETIYGANEPEAKPASSAPAKTTVPANQQTAVPAPALKDAGKNDLPKVVDSSVIPQINRPNLNPSGDPAESIKPPTTQKTALPDVKVNPKPKFAETPNANDKALGNVATALNGAKTDSAEAQEPVVAESDTPVPAKSKSDAVREKYQAFRDKPEQVEDAVDSAASSASDATLSKIDRIRLKYKRGIKFVQNEADERQQEEDLLEIPEDEYVETPQVGPYNEFLPEREIVVYNTAGRLDPFEPLVEDAQKSAGYDRIPDVDALRLVGVLLDKRSSRALFEDANGYSYILQTGDRVKNGFVLSISEDRVVFQIRQYGWNRQVALDLDENH